jgi:hypothetical protein
MKPPTFTKAEEPLAVDAWVSAIEAKFSAFVLPCYKELKVSFTTLQLRGEALMWWEHFKSMQSAGHEVTWVEFKIDFKDHHIPKGLMVRKMKELLALKQGDDTVYQYAQKLNNLCHYGEHHVDTDAKKMECFCDVLNGDMYKRLNLLEPNNYHELVNKAIVLWISLGLLPRWVPGLTTQWAPETTRLGLHDTCWRGAQGSR